MSESLPGLVKKRDSNMNLPPIDNDDDDAPDATVVVGGKEFRAHSSFLCYISGYFRGAIRSGMKESETLTFSFPDKDPAEWELFMSLMEPRSRRQVTKDNVEVILMWCTELCVTRAMDEVALVLNMKIDDLNVKNDAVVSPYVAKNRKKIFYKEEKTTTMKSNITELLRLLSLFEKYCLNKHKEDAIALLDQYIETQFDAFDAVNIGRILEILREKKDDDCYIGLRNSIVALIPAALVDILQDLPQHEVCLPHLIALELEKKEIRKNAETT
jgi:BTB/POZ domain